MSIHFDNSFITTWNAEAHRAFQQSESHLRNAVRVVNGVTGSQHKFHKIGAVEAVSNKALGAKLVPQNIEFDGATANLVTAHVPLIIPDLDQVKTNIDVRKEYTFSVSAGINREMDRRIVTAMSGTSSSVTAGSMDAAKVSAISKALNKNKAPKGDRYLVVSSGALEDMVNDNKLGSTDYLNKSANELGMIKNVQGFTVITLDDDLLPVDTTNKHTCFAFHKSALGLAIGVDVKFSVKEIPDQDEWLVLAKMLTGACLIDTKGVVKCEIDD